MKRKWGEDGSTPVEVTKPDERKRAIFFQGTKAYGADSAQSKSWGRPIRSWTISSRGQGSWTKASEMENGELARYDLEWREVDAGAEGAAKLSALLSQVPIPAPDSSKCTDFMTDSVHGTLRITRSATTTEIAWNSGCMVEEYRAFLAPLREADRLVAEWGEAGPYLRMESYGKTPESGS